MARTRVDQHEDRVGWKCLPVGKFSGQDGSGLGVVSFVNSTLVRKASRTGSHRNDGRLRRMPSVIDARVTSGPAEDGEFDRGDDFKWGPNFLTLNLNGRGIQYYICSETKTKCRINGMCGGVVT